ncbi:MAG: hypothetical protein K8W52_07030 [Deltaproteobacteria bacterium]|nr:hypothetical protein [Deltaproteobacteria bacterium]
MRYPWRKKTAPLTAIAAVGVVAAAMIWNQPGAPSSAHPAAVFTGHRFAYRVHTPAGPAWREQPAASGKDLDLVLIDGEAITVRVTATTSTAVGSNEELLRRFLRPGPEPGSPEVLDRQVLALGEDRALRVHARERIAGRDYDTQLEIVGRDDVFYVLEVSARSPVAASTAAAQLAIVRDFELPPAEVLLALPAPPLALPAPAPSAAGTPGAPDAPDQAYARASLAAQAGHVDEALYWLQRGAIDDGVDVTDVSDDPDFKAVVADARWPELQAFCLRVRRYYAHHPVEIEAVAVPRGYRAGTPIPLLIALHGLGDGAAQFFAAMEGQGAADVFGVAIVSVSGTIARGPHHFAWAEDPERDLARIDRALAKLRDRVAIAEGKTALLGFSQGAQLAVELAARHPERFAGAIGMSPGTLTERTLDGLAAGSLAKRHFVMLVGAGEYPGNVTLAADDAAKLRAAGAEVYHRAHPDQKQHSFPPDFYDAFGTWLGFVIDGKPIAP